MKCMERLIQKVRPDSWPAMLALDGRFDAIEKRLGFPSPRRYRCFIGASDIDTRVVEREWESMAAMEATLEKAFVNNPEYQALQAELGSAVLSNQWELYMVQ
jgi:hypothetical protein